MIIVTPKKILKTDTEPARLHLAEGVEIIDDVSNRPETVYVDTLEGKFGPLLACDNKRVNFIDMPAWSFCAEHTHEGGGITYTAKGNWVLCSDGKRHLMKPGSIFKFEPKMPTGYEVPFDESAVILLIGCGKQDNAEYLNRIREMSAVLEKKHEEGEPFLFQELPDDHPAVVFAKTVNKNYPRHK